MGFYRVVHRVLLEAQPQTKGLRGQVFGASTIKCWWGKQLIVKFVLQQFKFKVRLGKSFKKEKKAIGEGRGDR